MADFDFLEHLGRQHAWAKDTFGPGLRDADLSEHVRRELAEVAGAADHIAAAEEWIDVVILACEGALRRLEAAGHGNHAMALAAMLAHKMEVNRGRTWPDWRTAPTGQPIEHIRTGDPAHKDAMTVPATPRGQAWRAEQAAERRGYLRGLEDAAQSVRRGADLARRQLGSCAHEGHPEDADTWSAIISHLDLAGAAIRALAKEPRHGL